MRAPRWLSDLFNIIQGKGLVERMKCDVGVATFFILAVIVIAMADGIYGFAMGVSVSLETAWRDAIKVPAIFLLSYLLSLLPLMIAFYLVGGREPFGKVATLFISGFAAASIVLLVAAPEVFLYGVIKEEVNPIAHLVIINLGALLGIYMIGAAFYHAIEIEKIKLVVPVLVGVIFVMISVYQLIQFFHPFFVDQETFCFGIDRLREILSLE